MKYDNLPRLIEASACNSTMVYRVVSHKDGVGPGKREHILRLAQKMGFDYVSDPCDIYVILPEKPKYFWLPLKENLIRAFQNSNYRISFHSITHRNESYVISEYFKDACKCGAKLVLTAAHPDNAVAADSLELLRAHCPVFFLCEHVEGSKCFYFGNNSYDFGVHLGERCNQDLPPNSTVILTGSFPERAEGFSSVFSGNIIYHECNKFSFTFDKHLSPYSASLFARYISETIKTKQVDAIVCVDGVTELICSAIEKLGINIPCYGVELSTPNLKYLQKGILKCLFCQDLPATANATTEAAIRYLTDGTLPDRQKTYIPAYLLTRMDGQQCGD